MQIIKSDLILIDFLILKSTFHFVHPPENQNEIEVRVNELFEQYFVDVDFAIKPQNNEYHVFIKAAINPETILPGYQIFAEGVGIFKLNEEDKLSENEKNSLINVAAVNMALNNLRNYIVSLTFMSPFGKYILPSVNLNKLIDDKIKSISSDKNSS